MEQDRIKTAVEFLKDGQSFKVDALRLGIAANVIEVAGWSQYIYLDNLTKKQSLTELEEIKALFFKMVDTSLDLKNFILGKIIEYVLYFDDYGKGSIIICSERDNVVKWEIELR